MSSAEILLDFISRVPINCNTFLFPLKSSFPFLNIREVQLEKGVTSIALRGEGQQYFVGTEAAQMYHFSCDDFKAELISSSHKSAVRDVAVCA